MSWFYRGCIRPILFAQDPEEIHDRTMWLLGRASRSSVLREMMTSFFGAPPLPVDLFGLRFPNPVGLGAGMDKHAAALPIWPALGFGFAELGAVTWHAQPGNPSPRVFRAIAQEALINRMGFNNPGAEAVAAELRQWRERDQWPAHPVGINLGKSKITPLDRAAEDYAQSFRVLWPLADFFVINVSSPNTPNLRELQDKSALDEILAAVQDVNQSLAASATGTQVAGQAHAPTATVVGPRDKPILIKVAPELSFEALDQILELTGPRRVAGIVATNTTVERPATEDSDLQRIYAEQGGLSGRPLRQRSTEVIRHLHRQSRGTLPIIGVGGIFDAADAWEKIEAGASLIQVYTGLVYEGPAIAKTIVTGLSQRLQEEGIASLPEAVGRL